MWSILHDGNDGITKLGPFPSEDAAMAAARKAEGVEFDIWDCHVYLLHPDGRQEELSVSDFGEGFTDDDE